MRGMNINKYEQNLLFILQMHYYQEIKYNFKNYHAWTITITLNMHVSEVQMFKQAIKFTNYLQEENRAMKIQTNFKHSINVACSENRR